ncbi:flagellar basal body protein FliL [Candidatus Endoriftia persephone str. Guaymas]|nr:flagellar basal body protein FliL [Candidatus Endoriftia persephone str. Guaymas]
MFRKHLLMQIACLILFSAGLFATPLKAGEDGSSSSVLYYEISPSLVANLAKGGKYIRCDVQLMTKDEDFLEQMRLHGPAIRHELLLLLSEQDGKVIKTSQGKEQLRKQALESVSRVMKKIAGSDSVQALYFTTYYVK